MAKISNNQGRAYEYICLLSLYEAIQKIRPVEIVYNSSFDAAKKAWDTLSESIHLLYKLSAQSTIETIFALEPNIVEKDDDILNLYIQTDQKGKEGDV